MQIRKKLTYRFIAIVAFILFFSSLAIYISSADYRRDDFYNRLLNKARNTAKLLIEVEEVDAKLLQRMEQDNPSSLPEEKIVIFNYKNQRIFNTGEKGVLKISQELIDQIRLEEEVRYEENGYEVVGFMFADTYDRFVVIAAGKDIYGLSKLRNLRNILLFVFAISIIIVSISGWLFAGQALHPISKLVERVNNISITSLNLRLDEGKNQDEISQLAHTFNQMLERLEKAFKMQKNFIANASHELRTPLTAITGQLEVVLMKDRNEEEYRNTMASVLDDMKSLNHTSNRLLLLAQASSETSQVDIKPVRVDDLLWQVQQELTKRNTDYFIEIGFSETMEDEAQLTVIGNEQLLKTAISNLAENGCKYSDDHKMEIFVLPKSKHLHILFKDHGIGIAKEELKHIFEPFHRGTNALGYKGHGIGLSLVDRIVHLHNGKIDVTSALGQGTTFTLIMPYS
ncbi:sensor histidine kinase [Owenweeksia hongkongensis]|uniref:histidine kinase n=1 Tax=Owenweeksia hongkongensis (strain DSM 17368 / CIP 108786 / JCM 12287 / NRRL B-23963 / UST20020801) TaxID=926562 RepID=G8R3I5_OWEHD|nr:HAMP domain-containing sensor histidine kinase [Owenweeksia hongkongensis]AEV33041.1 signal transduction histidine kinase [Owenweeksia hongkongensis DSM 17368]